MSEHQDLVKEIKRRAVLGAMRGAIDGRMQRVVSHSMDASSGRGKSFVSQTYRRLMAEIREGLLDAERFISELERLEQEK